MANASVGAVRIIDGDGDVVESDGSGRLKVETEQDDAFTTWVTYPDFEVHASTSTAITDGTNGTGASISDAKEVVIQADDANTSYIMIGHSAGTTLSGSVGARAGLKLNGGETLVIALGQFSKIFLKAAVSGQYVNVAYFK
tara:strand:- start:25 stop:447 length:423 start_codon:yes stop_codon:yes gene_type:complete